MRKRGRLKRKVIILVFLFFLFAIFLSFFILGDTLTELEIPNSPPRLIMDIPNQSWDMNQNNTNAFDLDDYFEDAEGSNLSYYNSSVQNIYVYINLTTNQVSFYPDTGFSETRNVTFYASDSIYDSPSNVVFLFVGLDFYPPKWHTPSIDKTIIYQSDIVSFSTNWTDDKALKNYIFSINQGAGWINYSSINFSGTENFSSYTFQIMAPAFNNVYWRFYAFDTSGNINVTSIQKFVISSQAIPPEENVGGGGGGTAGGIFEGIDILKQRKLEDFQITPTDFKLSLKQGTFKTRVLKITNTGLQEINLSLSAGKIEDFTLFSEQNFSLMPGKSKEITIDFNAPERTIPGQYFGYISVKSNRLKKNIPTVLDIQALDLEFDLTVNLSKGYELVRPGKNAKVEINLFNLKDLREINASMYYAIKDYTGKVYNFSEEQVNFVSDLFLERELQVPEIAPEGKYIFYVRASDDKNIAIDSVSFEVGQRFSFASFLRIGSLLILILLFAILLAVFMVKHQREKKKERLIELYIMINKLKNLIKQNKEEEALELFIRIKKIYRDPIPKEIYDDKERLRKEISELYTSFTKDSKEIDKIKEALPQNKSLIKKDPSLKENETKKPETNSNKLVEENKKGLKEGFPKGKIENDKK